MGWDFVSYHGEHVQFDDFELWTAHHFLAANVKRRLEEGPSSFLLQHRDFPA